MTVLRAVCFAAPRAGCSLAPGAPAPTPAFIERITNA